ncbi:MAG: hypothetical protein ACR2O4_18540 [Hyphomicrobiaceae bacterium]
MSLIDVLADAQGGHCFANLSRHFQVTPEQAHGCAVALKPVIARQIGDLLQSDHGIESFLAALANPAVTAVATAADTLADPSIRHTGETMGRQLECHSTGSSDTIGDISRQAHVGHQTLRAMLPFLTLLFVAAIRSSAAPAFRKVLARHQPNDANTDPFEFVLDYRSRMRDERAAEVQPRSWLKQILSSTVPESEALTYRLDVSPERLSHVSI